jgi:hypothetical protein
MPGSAFAVEVEGSVLGNIHRNAGSEEGATPSTLTMPFRWHRAEPCAGSSHSGRRPARFPLDTPLLLAGLARATRCNCATSNPWQTPSPSTSPPALSSRSPIVSPIESIQSTAAFRSRPAAPYRAPVGTRSRTSRARAPVPASPVGRVHHARRPPERPTSSAIRQSHHLAFRRVEPGTPLQGTATPRKPVSRRRPRFSRFALPFHPVNPVHPVLPDLARRKRAHRRCKKAQRPANRLVWSPDTFPLIAVLVRQPAPIYLCLLRWPLAGVWCSPRNGRSGHVSSRLPPLPRWQTC